MQWDLGTSGISFCMVSSGHIEILPTTPPVKSLPSCYLVLTCDLLLKLHCPQHVPSGVKGLSTPIGFVAIFCQACTIQAEQQKSKVRYDRNHQVSNQQYQVGDWVLVRFPNEETGAYRKLSRPWHGPYRSTVSSSWYHCGKSLQTTGRPDQCTPNKGYSVSNAIPCRILLVRAQLKIDRLYSRVGEPVDEWG